MGFWGAMVCILNYFYITVYKAWHHQDHQRKEINHFTRFNQFSQHRMGAHTDEYCSLLLHQPCCSIVTWCLSVPSGPFDAVAFKKRLHHTYLCCIVQIYLYMQFCTHSTLIYYTCCFSFFQFILSHPAAILWTEQNLADDLFFKIKEHN